jgi:hypothetical protein
MAPAPRQRSIALELNAPRRATTLLSEPEVIWFQRTAGNLAVRELSTKPGRSTCSGSQLRRSTSAAPPSTARFRKVESTSCRAARCSTHTSLQRPLPPGARR